MCGIAGIASLKPINQPELLARMRDTMSHRGPDDSGQWWSKDGSVGLVHRRLAIIDLSARGHQPMADASGQFIITLNGEIYNYQDLRRQLQAKGHSFRSETDTEVLLEAYRAWGRDCLSHLNGMFAFCIYDIKENILFIARDRAGEKPLFYTYHNGVFAFASELKALMAYPDLPRKIDLKALGFYFTYGYIPGEHCILQGVRKLPPAHALSFDLSTHQEKQWQYWALPEPQVKNDSSIEDLSRELELLLEDSVKRQLVADVPVGILLSGGMDSSLITALASRVSDRPVQTFTVTFPGYGSYDEGPHAKLVADYFGTQHTEFVAEPKVASLLPELARQFDEPLCDSSMIPTYLVSKLIRQNAKAALGGDGGDELFGGYPSYNWVFKQEFARRYIPGCFRDTMSWAARSVLPHGTRGRNFLLGLESDLKSALSKAGVFFDGTLINKMAAPFKGNASDIIKNVEKYKLDLCQFSRGLPGMAMALDFKTYLPEDILVKVDRASMLNSLEVRAPMLDYRVIEFAFSRVPNTFRANMVERKILLKSLARRLLPAQFDLERKQGFSLPLRRWFRSEFGDFVKDILNQADPKLFDRSEIVRLIKDQNRGFVNAERLFSLTIFELWRREYKPELP